MSAFLPLRLLEMAWLFKFELGVAFLVCTALATATRLTLERTR